jgi:hypothetical protein
VGQIFHNEKMNENRDLCKLMVFDGGEKVI